MPDFSKSRDCLFVLILAYFGSRVIDMFIQPLSRLQWAGIALISIAAIGTIMLRSMEETDQVQEVLEAKKIKVAAIERVK